MVVQLGAVELTNTSKGMKPVEHARRIRKRRWQEALTKTQAKAHQFFMPRGTTASAEKLLVK